MKRSIVLLFTLLALLVMSTSCFARAYHNGDYNYPKVGMYRGFNIYVDRSSVAVDEYNPPIYQIHGRVLWVQMDGDGNDRRGGEIRQHTEVFRYNYTKGTMYHEPSPGDWSQLYKGGYNAEHMMHMGVGLEFFETAYNMEFPLR